MSYLVTAPEQVGSAAQNLAGIRSLLAGSAASAAAPTTAVAAAAQDEVSGLVATMFSNFGEEFQTLSAQADAFHEQFIGPRFLIHVAAMEMHPLDTEDRLEDLKTAHGIGL